MPLVIGTELAGTGMAQAIYQAMNEQLSGPPLPADTLPACQEGWKKLSYAIAKGVVSHILANMTVADITPLVEEGAPDEP